MGEEYRVFVKQGALEQAIRQGGEIRKKVSGNDINAPERTHKFSSEKEAFEWKDEIKEMNDSDGDYHFRSPNMNEREQKAEQYLFYRSQ